MTAPNTTNNTDPNAWLMGGGGAKAVSFPQVGASIEGTVEDLEMRVQTNIEGDVVTWPDGREKQQLLVTLQTKERNDADDDGKRTLYVKGYMQPAVKEAVAQAGAPGLEYGGTLYVEFVSQDPGSRGRTGAKRYSARFTRPNPSASFLGAEQPATAAPQQTQAAPAAPAEAPITAHPAYPVFKSMGMTDEAIAAAIAASAHIE